MASTTRSPRVAQGAGMFNLPKASFSKETQDLLKGGLDALDACMLVGCIAHDPLFVLQ